jgi:hypothetical protein
MLTERADRNTPHSLSEHHAEYLEARAVDPGGGAFSRRRSQSASVGEARPS